MARSKPNILVTGTPGTGKTSTCSLLADAVGLNHINCGDLVKSKSLHDGWDDELECFILNDDLVRIPSDLHARGEECFVLFVGWELL